MILLYLNHIGDTGTVPFITEHYSGYEIAVAYLIDSILVLHPEPEFRESFYASRIVYLIHGETNYER